MANGESPAEISGRKEALISMSVSDAGDGDASCADASSIFEPRLAEVAQWFHRRRLPYTPRIDTWLDDNGYDTVEMLKLVYDGEWRKLLCGKDQAEVDQYKTGQFRAFKHCIGKLRQIAFDELHDWRRHNLPDLPLAIYGKIGKFLATGKGARTALLRYPGKKKTITSVVHDLPGDLMSLCIAGGKTIADIVRKDYLHENEMYLRRAIFSSSKRNMKIMSWMQENPEWKLRCANSVITPCANYHRVFVPRENRPYFTITTTPTGSLCYTEYGDRQKTDILRKFDGLLYVNDSKVNGRTAQNVKMLVELGEANLSFLRDTSSLFSNPVQAISLGLAPVLKNMIDCKRIDPNDRFQEQWDPSTGNDAKTFPLLYHALFNTNITACFEYLITLANLDCGVEFSEYRPKENILFSCIESQNILTAMRGILAHPNPPDVNAQNGAGRTVLQVLLQVDEEDPYFEEDSVDKLRILLKYGANPMVMAPDSDGVLMSPLEHLREHAFWDSDEIKYGEVDEDGDYCSTDDQRTILEELSWLLEKHGGGKRSKDQPPITEFGFFCKRRRLA